jgi:hypothetical protein
MPGMVSASAIIEPDNRDPVISNRFDGPHPQPHDATANRQLGALIPTTDCFYIFKAMFTAGSPNSVELCVQSRNPGASAHSWTVFDPASNIIATGSSPTECWTIPNGTQRLRIVYTNATDECEYEFVIGLQEICPNNPFSATQGNNLCNWNASVTLNETAFIEEMPLVMHFEWLFPFITSSTTWHNIPVEDLHKLKDVCITYQAGVVHDIFSSVPLLLTCCYEVPIEYPCPPDLIESVVVDDFCAHIVTIHIDTDAMCEYGETYEIDLGGGYQTTSASSHTVQYASCGGKEVCIKWDISAYGNTREDLEDKTMECCYNITVPCCCLIPFFQMRRSTTSPSRHNPQYEFYDLDCVHADATWEFSDGTVFIGTLPPPHLFSNFVNDDGIVCVTRTIECCGATATYTACSSDFPPGAYIGRPGQTTKLSDEVPEPWGPRILDLIVDNMADPAWTRFDGTLQIDMEHTFVNGTWNAGKDFKILVKQETGLQSFRLQGTHIRSLARLGSQYAGCCRWRGIESEGLTVMAMTGATITDAQIMLHYPAQTAPNSGFLSPAALLRNSNFANNYYAVKSVGQYVSFTGLGLKGDTYGNTFIGAEHDQIVCDCAAVNAFDFRNVQSSWPIALNSPNGLSTIQDYEKAFHFENTSLRLRNHRIKDLWDTPHNAQDVPNNPSSRTGIGIDFTWTLPQTSILDIDQVKFEDFADNGNEQRVAIRDVVSAGAHQLQAVASTSLQSIVMDNLARGYHLEQYGTGFTQAFMADNLMNLQGNPWASGSISTLYSPGGRTELLHNKIGSLPLLVGWHPSLGTGCCSEPS